jgi:hypothetical protein
MTPGGRWLGGRERRVGGGQLHHPPSGDAQDAGGFGGAEQLSHDGIVGQRPCQDQTTGGS